MEIYPSKATVDAATKPYTVILRARANFRPGVSVWTINGSAKHISYSYTAPGDGYYHVEGPSITFSSEPTTILVTVYHKIPPTVETDSYTTTDARIAPSVSITVVDQKDGVPLVDGTSVPSTPICAAVAGEDALDLTWSRVSSALSQSRVWVQVLAQDALSPIARLAVNWGDGNTDNFDHNPALEDVIVDASHTYEDTTGSQTITATIYHKGMTTGVGNTTGITISTNASYWYAHQYRITRYQNQPGFRLIDSVGWRGVDNQTGTIRFYDVRKGNTYYYNLYLREIDITGYYSATSAASITASIGPWS